MKKGSQNKDNQKKYPLIPYIITLFAVVIAIVLVSYFAQMRNESEQLKASGSPIHIQSEEVAY